MIRVSKKGAVGALVLTSASQLSAQSIQGSILGAVRDASGAAVPAATVVITDTDTSVKRTVTTDSEGSYQALDLTADHYSVQVSAPGFETTTVTGLTLLARQLR